MATQNKYPRSYSAARIARGRAKSKPDPRNPECAKFVREALEIAGYKLPGNKPLNVKARHAFEYRSMGIMTQIGFTEININSKLEPGDVMIFDEVTSHKSGHIQIFDGEIWISDFKQRGDYVWMDIPRDKGMKYAHLYRDNSTGVYTLEEMAALSSGVNQGYFNDSPSSLTPLESEPTGLKYFHFDPNFIERGIRLYKEYYNKQDIEDNKEGRGSGDIGFVPLSLNLELEGISGWVIYDKIKVNQRMLPPQYPKNFNLLITGISHDISNNNWKTEIETISAPDLEPKKWDLTAKLTNSPTIATPDSVINENITPNQNKYMKMVYDSLITAGFNKNQSRILTAEIGRENSFNPNFLFGGHKDPHRGQNMGMISWQGGRRKKLIEHLEKQGLIKPDGRLIPSQQCLNAQARFIMWEMNNDREYLITKNGFLNKPNVSYEEGARILGTNYIRWRYGDRAFAAGHSNRDLFYKKITDLT